MTFSCRTAPWPGRLFSTSAQPISNRRYAKKIRGPGPSSLGIYEPQRGSVPKPNVVPRLRAVGGRIKMRPTKVAACFRSGERCYHSQVKFLTATAFLRATRVGIPGDAANARGVTPP